MITGMPEDAPPNALKAERLAHESGWQTWVTEADPEFPRSLVIRFHKHGFPRLYVMWKRKRDDTGWTYHRGYASTAQRLSWGDLGTVLADPDVLLDVDPDNPFNNDRDGLLAA